MSGGLVFPDFENSLEEFSTVCCDPHSQILWCSQESRDRCFSVLSCFFYDPIDVGNLISGSSAFSKSSLNMWKLSVHVLLKSCLENFEHCFASIWDECNCMVIWTFFGIAFLWDWNENRPFPSHGHCWVFQICWHIECSILTALSFRIWNSSTKNPSSPLALFVVMLPKAYLTLHSRMNVWL